MIPTVRRPVNDNEIIERALHVGEITGKDVILAAADYSITRCLR